MDSIQLEDWSQIWHQVRKKDEIGLFWPILNKESANNYTRPDWKIAYSFALMLLKSFKYTLKGRSLKMDTIRFEDPRQIWRQRRKKLQIGLFSLISNKQSANFHTRLGWKLTEWFAMIHFASFPYTLKGGTLEMDTIRSISNIFQIPWKGVILKMDTIRFVKNSKLA